MNKLLIVFIWLGPFGSTQAAEIPRPAFDQQRQFHIAAAQAAQPLPKAPLTSFVFDHAIRKCNISPSSLENNLSQTVSEDSAFMTAVRSLFPNFKLSQLKGVRLLIDSFGPLSSAFRSFYIPVQKNHPAAISLDCSPTSQLAWPALLGHESVHHLNQHRNLAPWVDEMLAQVVEVRAANSYPYLRFESLKDQAFLPSFFARDRVFQSSRQYAVNMLFGLYISQLFGGETVFQSLNKDVRTLSDFSRKLSQFTKSKVEYDWIRPFISPRGLIRHFTLAMNINLPTLNDGPIYQAPGWQSFVIGTELKKSGSYYIEPGGSLRLSARWSKQFHRIPKNAFWDVYRILKYNGTFQIQNPDDPVVGDWSENYLLLVNGSETEYLQIDLP